MTGVCVCRFSFDLRMRDSRMWETYLYGHRLAAPWVSVAPGQLFATRCLRSSALSVAMSTPFPIFGASFLSSWTASIASASNGSVQKVRQPVTERYSQDIFLERMYDATSAQFLTSNAAISGVRSKRRGWRWPPFYMTRG